MVERVKISPNEIIIKNSAGTTTFNTANLYLKTDATGQLKAGGYLPCTVVSGYAGGSGNDTIGSRDFGWYNAGKSTVARADLVLGAAQSYIVPAASAIKLFNDPVQYGVLSLSPIEQVATINGVDQGHRFRWMAYKAYLSDAWFFGPQFDSTVPIAQSGILTFSANTVTDFTTWPRYATYPSGTQLLTQAYNWAQRAPGNGTMLTKRNPETLSVAVTP